jgi:hypothetical protein
MPLPEKIEKFLAEHFPADDLDLAGYVICIAKRDKTMVVAQGYDNIDTRDKVAKALNRHIELWEVS